MTVAAVLVVGTLAYADIAVPGADGSDGALSVSSANLTIDLSQAPTSTWNAANPNPGLGKGVYDPDKWAVVFRYSSVNIAAGRTVTFTNHPSRAPVVWLVNGSVTIAGTLNLNGASNTGAYSPSEPGPGGFRGGRGSPVGDVGSGGFGPGGAGYTVSPAHYSSNASYSGSGDPYYGGLVGSTYGNDRILPLIGGSGGAATNPGSGGASAGGGAILIAANGVVALNGTILVSQNGSSSGNGHYYSLGSGGAVRIIADQFAGTTTGAFINASSLSGAAGRIRVEANQFTYVGGSSPTILTGNPDVPPLIWPAAGSPTLRVMTVTTGGSPVSVPTDPRASFGLADVNIRTTQAITLSISAANVPLDWPVVVRVVSLSGDTQNVTASPLQGSLESSTTTATLTPPKGFCAIQLRAYKP